MISRLIYFGYYLKSTDRKKLSRFLKHSQDVTGKSKISLLTDVVISSFRYKVSFLDYFYFRFYEKGHDLRSSYAGTAYMYEVHNLFNPLESRNNIHKKDLFFENYRPFVKHDFATLKEMQTDAKGAERLLSNPSGKIVLKNTDGECGTGVEVHKTIDFTSSTLVEYLQQTGNDLVEEFVTQHPDLMKLSSSGLNTVRIITQLNAHNQVDIIGATLRITVNSAVDNLAAGNIAAPLDLATGEVTGPAIYSDITKEETEYHPITGERITGFLIPFWKETIELVKKAALHRLDNRSIGWDMAITENGPDIIEANHAWCKLVWQLPGKKGLRMVLDKYRHGA